MVLGLPREGGLSPSLGGSLVTGGRRHGNACWIDGFKFLHDVWYEKKKRRTLTDPQQERLFKQFRQTLA